MQKKTQCIVKMSSIWHKKRDESGGADLTEERPDVLPQLSPLSPLIYIH